MRHRKPNGVEISGFIDYEESLRKCIDNFKEAPTDWYAVFHHSKRIWPTKQDLGFVYCHVLHNNFVDGTICTNNRTVLVISIGIPDSVV